MAEALSNVLEVLTGIGTDAQPATYSITGASATTSVGEPEPATDVLSNVLAVLTGIATDAQPASYTITGADAGTVLSGTEPALSNVLEVLTAPARPTSLANLGTTANSVTVGWTDETDGEFPHRVWFREVDEPAGDWLVAGTVDAAEDEFQVSGLAGVEHEFSVTAYNGALESGLATAITATPSAGDIVLSADPATYAITGADAGLDVDAPAAIIMDAQPASYTITGAESGTVLGVVDIILIADPATFAVTGSEAGTEVSGGPVVMDAQPATYSIVGANAGTGIPVLFDVPFLVVLPNPGEVTIPVRPSGWRVMAMAMDEASRGYTGALRSSARPTPRTIMVETPWLDREDAAEIRDALSTPGALSFGGTLLGSYTNFHVRDLRWRGADVMQYASLSIVIEESST
jgi:hypothetical protein